METCDNSLNNTPYNDTKFVGRRTYIEKLELAWESHCVFGIFGIRSVGKSRLVREFLDSRHYGEDGEGSGSRLLVFSLDLRTNTDLLSVYSTLCACLYVLPEPDATLTHRWIDHVTQQLGQNRKYRHSSIAVLFDNAENVIDSQIADPFLSMIIALIKKCPHVKTFITSTTKVQFSQYGRVFFSCDLAPLTATESLELLRWMAPRVELNQYKEPLIKLSEGLPLLILMIGAELEDETSPMTPAKMVETLSKCRLQTCSERAYTEQELTHDIGEIYKNFILRLTQVYQDRLKILQFIPGSFNAYESMQMLGYETVSMVKGDVLVHLHRRFMIVYDRVSERFDIQGILRESLHMYFTLSNITEVRSSYCRTFSSVIQSISDRLGTAECSKALKEFAIEQTNLRKFLQEVLFTKEDTYPFYLEVASSCALLIENFMEGESENFYNGCLRAADEYGRPGDKAIIHVSIGSLYTNIKEDLPRGAEMLRSAIDCLINTAKTRKIHLATAYQRLGWNLHKQGRNEEAVKILKRSYAISSQLDKDATVLLVQNMNSLGLVNDMLGNFSASEEYHFKSLYTRRSRLGRNHPSIGPTLNNIGTFFKKKGNFEKALQFFTESLVEKKLHKEKLPVLSLVDSLCNVAEELVRLREYDKAHKHLNEAWDLLREQDIPSREGLAMMYHIRGRAFQAQQQYKEASKCFTESISVRQEAFPEDIGHLESIVDKAEVEFSLGNIDIALKLAKSAMQLKCNLVKTMPYTLYYLKCLDRMAVIYKHNDTVNYFKTLQDIESELLRLEQISIECINEDHLNLLRTRMVSVKYLLDKRQTEEVSLVRDSSP